MCVHVCGGGGERAGGEGVPLLIDLQVSAAQERRSPEANPMCIPSRQVTGSQPPFSFPVASHLGVVHVPEKVVGLGVQNEVPPQKLATVLILLDVQKPTDSVLPIHIRHSWALFTSPCMAGGREVLVEKEGKVGPASGPAGTSLWPDSPLRKLAWQFLASTSFPGAPNVFPNQSRETFYQFHS